MRGTPIDRRRSRVDAEVVRLLELGATHVRTVEDDTDYFAWMQDPKETSSASASTPP
ncbi:hypothetical protein [Amycolatopsis sp.]|uniref:hypothetical protein n=1 Tax=Amycolatopsis sp. TaxID=37632 RepID=UPI00345AC079